MATRTLDLSTYPHKHQPLMDWITANGLQPNLVPVNQKVQVTQGDPVKQDSISLILFVRNGGGHLQLGHNGPLYEEVTVPLISPLEAHGL